MDTNKLEKAVIFLIRKSDLTPEEAYEFIDFLPVWESGTRYPLKGYVVHGVDEKGNPQLWKVRHFENTDIEPGTDAWNNPAFMPVKRN